MSKQPASSLLSQRDAKKRKALALRDKLEIIEYAQANPKIKHNDIGVHFGCGRSTISKILQKKDELLEEEQKGIKLTVQKRREPHWTAMEQALITWINQATAHNMVITDEIVRVKAKEFAASIYSSDNALSTFTASDGWLAGFKTRYNLKSYRLHGEAASAPLQELDESRNKLQEILANYQPEDIFNADETGLFFRLLPNQTLASSSRKGTKKDKERITVLLTTNATGTIKLKPLIIGKSAQPRYVFIS